MIYYFLAALEVSISPLGYEVDESAGVVQVTVQKSGIFPTPVTGTITSSAGTAGTQAKASLILTSKYNTTIFRIHRLHWWIVPIYDWAK